MNNFYDLVNVIMIAYLIVGLLVAIMEFTDSRSKHTSALETILNCIGAWVVWPVWLSITFGWMI